MAQKTAVIRQALSATLNGTTDFTESGFGTVSAAIVVLSNANNINNPQDGAILSVGFWDGTSQRCSAYSDIDFQSSTATSRAFRNDYISIAHSSSSYSCSAVADGIRLTLDVDNTGAGRYATVILLGGVSAKVLTHTPNSTQNGTATETGIGFDPELLLFIGTGDSGNSETAYAILSYGLATSAGTHKQVAFSSVDSQSTATLSAKYSETYCAGQLFNGTQSWSLEVTSFGTGEFTTTTRDGGSGGDEVFCLALGGADLSYEVGTLTTPTATGNDVTSTTIAPDALLLALTGCSAVDTLRNNSEANPLSFGMAGSSVQYSLSGYSEDGASTTNTGSVADTDLINLDSSSSGSRTDLVDGSVTLNSSDFTINYTTVDATARKGWWLAFGAAGGGTTLSAATAWSIYNTQQKASAWRILTSTNQAAAWSIYTSDSQDSAWKIKTTDSQDSAWSIRTAGNADIAWRIESILARSSAWRIRNANSLDSSWKVYGQTSQDTAWKILTSGAESINLAWKIRNADSTNSAWKILNTASTDSAWKIANAQAIDAAWQITTTTSTDTAWSIQTQAQIDTAWKIVNAGTAALSTAWKIYATDQTSTEWVIRAATSTDTSWSVHNLTDTDLSWRLRAQASASTEWMILTSEQLQTAWALNSELIPEPVKTFYAPNRTVLFHAQT